jgi:hypothetical protein
MFRFLKAPFQRQSGDAKGELPDAVSVSRHEFEQLFRDDLAAHSLTLGSTRLPARANAPDKRDRALDLRQAEPNG